MNLKKMHLTNKMPIHKTLPVKSGLCGVWLQRLDLLLNNEQVQYVYVCVFSGQVHHSSSRQSRRASRCAVECVCLALLPKVTPRVSCVCSHGREGCREKARERESTMIKSHSERKYGCASHHFPIACVLHVYDKLVCTENKGMRVIFNDHEKKCLVSYSS